LEIHHYVKIHYIKFMKRNLLLGFALTLIISCQTPIDRAGNNHKIVTEKWYELSKYAESRLQNYGVTITAKLGINNLGQYQLVDIRLNTKETLFNINLLTPIFDYKYICAPVCIQLVEYKNSSNLSGYTLLTSYFDKHEYQLYKFYGEVMLINNEIKQLELINHNILPDYLNVISKQEKAFNSPSEFIEYLRSSLTQQAFLSYIDSPIDPTIPDLSLLGNEVTNWKKRTIEETSSWKNNTAEEQYLSPDSIWLSKGLTEDERISLTSIETFNSRLNINSEDIWDEIRHVNIKKNDTVCSYAENMFGRVIYIQGNVIKVLVQGQAKKTNDNIISNPQKGFLFKLKQTINFTPLYGYKDFQRSNIALCTFN
jgi:hypothetical protein